MNNDKDLKKYTSGDMGDAHSLAKDDLWCMVVALQHLTKEMKNLAEAAKENSAKGMHFDSVLDHLNMYEYLAQERHDSHEKCAENYFSEWEMDKAVINTKNAA